MKRTLCFLILFAGTAAADDMQLIRNAFEAGNDAEAKELLLQMQQQALPEWKSDALLYNLGTVELAAGHANEALGLFRAMLREADPYLEEKAMMNAAVALWRSAKQLLPITSFSAMREAIQQLHSALDALYLVDSKQYPNAETLRQAVKPLLVRLLEERRTAWERHGALRDGVLDLLIGLHRVQDQVDFFLTAELSEEQIRQYTALYSKQQESWFPLWEFLGGKDLRINKAKNDFQKGMETFGNKKFAESFVAFEKSIDQLKALLQDVWGKDAVSALLVPLYGKYQRALEQETLTALPFEKIAQEQSLLLSVIPELERSQASLQSGIAALKNDQEAAAKIYLAVARQEVQSLLRDPKEKEPGMLLESAIEDQLHALNIGNMVWLSGEPSLSDIPIAAQKETLQTAQPFLKLVFAWQNARYPEKCQCRPWDQVLPLFEKGRIAAKRAAHVYQEGAEKAPIALALEKQALDYWEKALQAMRRPAEQQEKQQPEKSREEVPAMEIEDVLRLLQEMEQDDRKPKQQAQPMKGVKPW